ncbi:hypothetical protein C8R43DRAFT_1126359 [Mycena crocata]|nr:hypothetical protein C8R43DRAFT_1126359 [Mycena crocata]
MDEEWDFFFQPWYQSTDESDDSPVLDPETDSGGEVDVATPNKPWISREPDYRGQQLKEGVVAIDRLVLQARNQREKDQGSKRTGARDRRRGPSKDVPLPVPGPGKLKIPREAICPVWLAANKEDNDHPSRIQEPSNADV